MQTMILSEAKAQLGRLVKRAAAGEPVLIVSGMTKAQLTRYEPIPTEPLPPPGYFNDCYADQKALEAEARRGRLPKRRRAAER
ncbi:MAG: type II toxin-antitoxin system prevent-host-death family antitoxin [Verrucomicrobia bacterium]|nr:type II toxin-antitoxin system prevent-host-death family antitoxin [Verrucomicrobiota bacterium]